MSIQDIGAIGELIAAIATVATLAYLAVQVRDNSRALDRANDFERAASLRGTTEMFNDLVLRLANDGELADIYTRALAGETLGPTETTRFTLYVTAYLTSVEGLVSQQSLDLGYTDLEADSVVDFFAPTLRSMLQSQAGAEWWRQRGRHLFVGPFRTRVEAALERQAPKSAPEAS